MGNLPKTQAQVFYAYQILIAEVPIGTLSSFSPRMTRTTDAVREIQTTGGKIVEIVPGVTTYTLDLEKVMLYTKVLKDVFGILDHDIQNQIEAIDIKEQIYKPTVPDGYNGSPEGNSGYTPQPGTSIVQTTTYTDCWITSWDKSVSTGTTIITERMSVVATNMVTT